MAYFAYPYPFKECFDSRGSSSFNPTIDRVELPGGLTAAIHTSLMLPTTPEASRRYHFNLESPHWRTNSSMTFFREQVLWLIEALAKLPPPCQEPVLSLMNQTKKLFPGIPYNELTAAQWHIVTEQRRAWIADIYDPAMRARQDAILAILKILPVA